MQKKILIVEDEFVEAGNLQRILERAGYEVLNIARSVSFALDILATETPDLVLLDIYLRGRQTGIDLAKTLRERDIAFIYLSANSNPDILNLAKKTEPYGFLVKPFREKDVLVTLDVAHYLHQQQKELREKFRIATPDPNTAFSNGIVGNSPVLRKVLEHIRIVAPTETLVLILGESGTGKEKLVEQIHALSPRKQKTLVKVNCAAMPSTLIESILFGHEKGSFTGATEKHTGKFEQAHGGTIFLDEIGEMPLDMQVKLLRVLQEKEVEKIGGKSPIKINVRIVAATNRDLEKEVAEGRFRMDLYYRLNVFPVTVPPLRERKEDIPLLAEHFISRFAQINRKKVKGLSEKALEILRRYPWPGNIRELEHVMERCVLLAEGPLVKEDQLQFIRQQPTVPSGTSRIKTMQENETEHIREALKVCNGKLSGPGGAAEVLGLPYSTLVSRIKKLGIRKELNFQ